MISKRANGAPVAARETAEGERYVIYGASRLAVAVTDRLLEALPSCHIAYVAAAEDPRLHEREISFVAEGVDRRQALHEAGLSKASCLLALSDDDALNVRAALDANAVVPEVPLVLHIEDAAIAEHLEKPLGDEPRQRGHAPLNVRGAYSMSALSAPYFVALALSDKAPLMSRFRQREVGIASLTVAADSRLANEKLADVMEKYGSAVVAVCRACAREGQSPPRERLATEWDFQFDENAVTLEAGDKLLVGGYQEELFPLLFANREHRTGQALRAQTANVTSRVVDTAGRSSGRESASVVKPSKPSLLKRRPRLLNKMTLSPFAMLGLLLPLALGVMLVGSASIVDGFYLGVRTIIGEHNYDSQQTQTIELVVGTIALLAGAALLALVGAELTAYLTSHRIGETSTSWRVKRTRNHVVVVGLGSLGHRIVGLLRRSGIQAVVLNPLPTDPFSEAVGMHAPVVAGDIRLEENLDRVGITKAVGVIACSEDNLGNLEACLHAKQKNGRLTAVARIFDDEFFEDAADDLGIDHTIAAVERASPAFVDAATEARAGRSFDIDGLTFRALAYEAKRAIGADEVVAWRRGGVCALAIATESDRRAGVDGRDRGRVRRRDRGADKPNVAAGDWIFLVGPEEVLLDFVAEDRASAADRVRLPAPQPRSRR